MEMLQKEEAKQKSSKFQSHPIQYTFTIQFYKAELYEGLAEIEFYLKDTEDIYLDCDLQKIERLRINDDEVVGVVQDKELYLSEKYLRKGRNIVLIEYRNRASESDSGLIWTLEAHQPVYITQLEPCSARTMFPVFDQPDLKGQMTLVVICNSKHHVLSNQKPIYQNDKIIKKDIVETVGTRFSEEIYDFVTGYQNGRVWIFPKTEILPTYLFCMAVGDFKEIECPFETKVPMSLFCTSEFYGLLSKQSDLIFKVTIEGMKFFESYFQTPYAFSKYDQLFTKASATAMENAGISIFSKNYLEMEEGNLEKSSRLCQIILHELCHHWFGNLATMEYWDDIWLNEGITTFMQTYSLKCILPFLDSVLEDIDIDIMLKKNVPMKMQMTSQKTHPVRLKHVCCDHMFDDLVYKKGAAITQMYHHLIGKEFFSEFCREVFTQHRFKNWTTDDFFRIGQKYFPDEISLKEWMRMFVDTGGITTLNSEIDGEKGGLVVSQVEGERRYFSTEVAVFREDGSYDIVDCEIKEQSQVVEVGNTEGFKAVLINPRNINYLSQNLSPESLQFFRNNIHRIDSDLVQAIIYYSIPPSTRFQSFTLLDNLLTPKLPQKMTSRYLSDIHSYWKTDTTTPSPNKIDFLTHLTTKLQQLHSQQPDPVKRKYFSTYNTTFKQTLSQSLDQNKE